MDLGLKTTARLKEDPKKVHDLQKTIGRGTNVLLRAEVEANTLSSCCAGPQSEDAAALGPIKINIALKTVLQI